MHNVDSNTTAEPA